MWIRDVELDDNALIRAWYANEPLTVVTEQLHSDSATLKAAWRHLKHQGRLPRGDRPYRRDSDAVTDGRPKVAESDPLLAKLLEGKR